MKSEFIKLKYPKFVKSEARVDSLAELLDMIALAAPAWANNIVDLELNGTAESLKSINPSDWSERIKVKTGARQVQVKLNFDHDQFDTKIQVKKSDEDDWHEFLNASAQDNSIDVKRLELLGLEYIRCLK